MYPSNKDEILRLQTNLHTIRQAGGWSTSKFGDLLGVSKQTVCNLENGTTKLSKLQYIGIRAILDYEIKQNPTNELLPYVVHHLLDSDKTTENDIKQINQAIAYTSGARNLNLDPAIIAAGLGLIIGTSVLSLALPSTSSEWISTIMKK